MALAWPAGAHTAAAAGRGPIAAVAASGGRSLPRGQDGRSAVAGGTSRDFARTPLRSAALSGLSCLGDADAIFHRLYGQLRELGWLGRNTMVVIVGDGAEWIWKRAAWFIHRCEILDFWHALEHAWEFAHLRFGEGSTQADQWVHQIGVDLKAGQVEQVIARLKRLRPKSPQVRASLDSLIRYYSENASRMQYDTYLRLGYGIGSGAVESAHKQVVHARLRQAGMRWSEAGARRLLALRLLLLNNNWALLDRLTMASNA